MRFVFRQDFTAGQTIEQWFEGLRHGALPSDQAALRLGEGKPAKAKKFASN